MSHAGESRTAIGALLEQAVEESRKALAGRRVVIAAEEPGEPDGGAKPGYTIFSTLPSLAISVESNSVFASASIPSRNRSLCAGS